ncbi:MAG: O-antigen ligase family protein [Patescibacteria group bacterium]
MRITKAFLYIFILSLTLGQLGSYRFGEGVVYISDLLLAALIVIWLLESFLVIRSLRLERKGIFIFLFGVVSLLTLLNATRFFSSAEIITGSLYWFRWVAYALVYFLVRDLITKGEKIREPIIFLLIVDGLFLALSGFIQLAVIPDFRLQAVESGWDPHKNRLLSTFFDPNFTGAFLSLTLSLVISRLFSPGRKLLYVVALPVLLLALLLTFSRSAWLMFGVIILVFGLLRSRWLLLLAVFLAFSAYFFVPRVQTRLSGVTDPADSAHFRLISWNNTLKIAGDYPLSGVGFNLFRYAQADYGFFGFRDPSGGHAGAGSDSSWLLVLATTGVFGFLIFSLLYLRLLLESWKARGTVVGLALLAALAGLVVETNFINALFYVPIMSWVWLVAALL